MTKSAWLGFAILSLPGFILWVCYLSHKAGQVKNWWRN